MGAWQSSFQSPWKDAAVRTNTSEPILNTTTTCVSTNIMPCIFPPPFTHDFPAQYHATTVVTLRTTQPTNTAMSITSSDPYHPTATPVSNEVAELQPAATPVSSEIAKLLPRDDWRFRHFCKAGKPTENTKNDGTQGSQGAMMEKDWYC